MNDASCRIARRWLPCALLAAGCLATSARAQTNTAPAVPPAATAATTPAAVEPTAATGCCGPITPAGQQLLQVLDRMDVEHRWLADRRVDWKTGSPRGPMHMFGKPDTHCSAFAAAAGERLGVYMLRPPEHSQNFLATAQGRWFSGSEARDKGWVRVSTSREAQQLANEGALVVLNYANPERGKHGHIAVVRPAVKSGEQLAEDGPETMQAGLTNFADGNAKRSFHSHPGAWPDNVTMWAHRTKFGVSEDVSEAK